MDGSMAVGHIRVLIVQLQHGLLASSLATSRWSGERLYLFVTHILYGDHGAHGALLSVDNFHQKLPIRVCVLVLILEQSPGRWRNDATETFTLFQYNFLSIQRCKLDGVVLFD